MATRSHRPARLADGPDVSITTRLAPGRVWVSVIVASSLGLGACSGNDSEADAADAVTSSTPSSTSSTGATITEPTTASPTTAPPTSAAAATTTEPAPSTVAEATDFEPIGPGPYQIGAITLTLDDPARPLTVDVWFPVAAKTEGAPFEYTLLPGVGYTSPTAIGATASDLPTGERYPLVVYSHGSGGLRYIASYYTEAIASHGYVVVAPDHTGNTAVDRLAGSEVDFDITALNRPNDVAAVIDAFGDPAHPTAGPWASAIDPERIAVTGHSFGGFTALAMPGGYTNPLGEFIADPRVDAVIPLAPAVGDGTRLLSDADLAAIDVPMLVMVGTDDITTPVDPNVTRLWEHAQPSPRYRVELVAAEHQSFTDLCDYQAAIPQLEAAPQIVIDTINTFATEGCSPGDMPIERAKDITNSYAIAFLDQILKVGADVSTRLPVAPVDAIVTT